MEVQAAGGSGTTSNQFGGQPSQNVVCDLTWCKLQIKAARKLELFKMVFDLFIQNSFGVSCLFLEKVANFSDDELQLRGERATELRDANPKRHQTDEGMAKKCIKYVMKMLASRNRPPCSTA